jgi:hypothetical protein
MVNKIKMVVLSVLIILPLVLNAQQKESSHKRYALDKDGNKMVMRTISGKPPKDLPKPQPVHVPKDAKASFYLQPVPCYDWSFGCTATASSMFAGYYDNYGADNIYIGPENGGLQPMSNAVWNTQASANGTSNIPVAASFIGVDGRTVKGHREDYWVAPDDESDPYFGNWTEHDYNVGQRATGDFMGTNQWNKWGNIDSSTSLWAYMAPSGGMLIDKADEVSPPARDGIHGIRLFFESIGYDVDMNYTQLVDGWIDPDDTAAGAVTGGYTFAKYKASIDAGRPVMIGLDNHSVLGYGYDDSTTPPTVYIRSTWYNNLYTPGSETMPWGVGWNGMYHYAMSEIILSPKTYYSAPDDVFALNNNRTVTITWSDPSEGTKNLTYNLYRDDVFLVNVATPTYIDHPTDGVHRYKVKSLYSDPTPDLESFFSNEAAVYVSVSVTEFHDTFESGNGQWLLYNGWGLDTQYKYAGTYSLSDSPAINYVDGLEDLPAGGSVGEIAPGLNFTNAKDASCDFYLRYVIEESFDYLHFQSCKDGVSWVTLQTWSSEVLGTTFSLKQFSLGVFAGEPNVRFRFIMQSDGGYNAAGTNIDNINIVPSSTDTSPPFVYYSKPRDFYDNDFLNGFEIKTDIIDVSGVNYAHVVYNVNGGSNIILNPASITGNEYRFVIPVQNLGDHIEFDFDCRDNATVPNTGTYGTYRYIPGPFFYQAGWHRVFDNGWVTYIGSLSSTPADDEDNYLEAVAVKFSSFHDDVEGVVVRGYTDQGQLPNANMLIQFYTDNNGLPGTAVLPSPVAVANPATTSETQKWAYVDLSSYSQLKDLVGTYHVAISSGTNNSGYTIIDYTEASEDQMFAYGVTSWKYVHTGETVATWEAQPTLNQHTRIVTTDKGLIPGTIETNPLAISETVLIDGTSSKILAVNNVGDYSLDYNGSISYSGFASGTVVHSNAFTTVLGWTSAGTRPWTRVTTLPGLNGTGYATVSAATTGGATTNHSYLTSAIINMSAYGAGSTIAFDQVKSAATSTGALEVSNDGTNWFELYSTTAVVGAMGAPNHQTIQIPLTYCTATARFRFHASLPRSSGNWNIDNIVVSGAVPYSWMTVDGNSTTSGTIAASASDNVSIGFNAAGLALGTYVGAVNLTSTYSNKTIIVQLTVSEEVPNDPVTPANVVTSISGANLVIDWDVSANATGYDVYASDDPYGTFTVVQSVATNQYTVAYTASKKFYYIVATNAAKTSKKQTRIVIEKKTDK